MLGTKTKLNVLVLCGLFLFIDTAAYASDELLMGIFPRRNSTATIKMFTPLAKYLEIELNQKVKVQTAKNFPTFWKKVQSREYDIAHFNQVHYILSHKNFGYHVFAKNEEFDRSELRPTLVVRKDSGIETVADLKGKSIAFGGGRLAMISYIGVKRILQNSGLGDLDYKSTIAKNPPNAAMAVYFKKADASGIGDVVLRLPSIQKKIEIGELKVLARGGSQPHITWAANSKLGKAKIEKIQNAFLGLNDSEDGKKILKKAVLTGILSAHDSEYNISRSIYKRYKKWNEESESNK